jgi:hypothetical protein
MQFRWVGGSRQNLAAPNVKVGICRSLSDFALLLGAACLYVNRLAFYQLWPASIAQRRSWLRLVRQLRSRSYMSMGLS